MGSMRPAVVALIASAGASILMLGLFQAELYNVEFNNFRFIEFRFSPVPYLYCEGIKQAPLQLFWEVV